MPVAAATKPRAPRATSDTARTAKRLAEIERQFAIATSELKTVSEGMEKVISDTEEGRKILARLNDQWLAGRAFTWGKVAAIGAISTYPSWSPFFFKVIGIVLGGPRG